MAVTMKDVALRAKVSVATVSKCLSGQPSIPARTREAVRRIAEAMGYRPHPYISALMQTRRKKGGIRGLQPTLAYVTAFPTENGWQREAFFRSLHAGAQTRAETRGYVLQPYWLYRDGMTNERFSEILWARGIRGIFLSPFPRLGMEIKLDWSKFSVVAHGLSLASPVFHRTSNDHYQSMLLAMHECQRRGYLRPAFALDAPTTERLEFRWEAAYQTAMEKLGFQRKIPPLLMTTRWEPDQLCRWVKRTKPDVVITLILEDQVRELVKRGLRIPEKIGLVSLSVARAGSDLSGVFQDPFAMGEVAVDQLIKMVERNETGVPADSITLTLAGQWNPGRTLRRLPDKPGGAGGLI